MRFSIRWKVMIPIALVLILTLGSGAMALSALQRKTILDDAAKSCTDVAGMVEDVMRLVMAENLNSRLPAYIEQVEKKELIDELRLLVSEKLGGGDLKPDAEEEKVLHGGEIIVETSDGKDVLPQIRRISPIKADQACLECHDDSKVGDVMAAVSLRYSLAGPERAAKRNAWGMAVGSVALIVFLSMAVLFLVNRFVIRPIRKVVAAADELAVGDIEQSIQIQSRDELGQLCESFGRMIDAQKGMVNAAEAVSKGDLSVTVTPKSAKDTLAFAMGRMVESIQGLQGGIQAAIGQIRLGRLEARGDEKAYQGAWGGLMAGVNRLADVLVGYLDTMPAPALIIDKDRTILYINKAAAGVIGLPVEEIAGTKCFTHFKTSDCQNGNCACLQSMRRGEAVTRETDAHPRGLDLDISYTGIPVRDESGATVGSFEVVTDLTEIRKAQRMTEKNAAFSRGEINKLLEELKELADGSLLVHYAVAAGDGDVNATRENFLKIAESLNSAVRSLHDAMSQVATASEQVSSASVQIASGSQQVAAGASQMAASLEEASSSLEEMASMTKQTSDNAMQASGLAQTAKTAADGGSRAMNEMMSAMGRIKQASEGTGQIIRDINEIAFQTNLLALNAAVEAARAGEAGRGFAVVAEEVRNLALRSKAAAKRTEELIQESVRLAGEGEGISKQVNVKLNEIVGVIGKVTDIVGEIATASGEQSRGIEQVNKAVAQMDQVTQQNAASCEESSSATEELSGQAAELTAMVGRFTLSEQTKPRAEHRDEPVGKFIAYRY